jgi:hypothetical protein
MAKQKLIVNGFKLFKSGNFNPNGSKLGEAYVMGVQRVFDSLVGDYSKLSR